MSKLYELAQAYKNISELAEDETIDSTVLETALQQIEASIEVKAYNIGALVKGYEHNANIVKCEIDRLTKIKNANDNRAKRFKGYLKEQMELAGIDKIANPVMSVRLQKNSQPSMTVDEGKEYPAKYYTIVPEQLVLNREELKKAA